ncbi:hypothetical protein CDD83_325 [Cordyceps sp. RAO-2017]|nr:hypothetical protein CDD83_325 [Cordyceps sp. RAO-2017]
MTGRTTAPTAEPEPIKAEGGGSQSVRHTASASTLGLREAVRDGRLEVAVGRRPAVPRLYLQHSPGGGDPSGPTWWPASEWSCFPQGRLLRFEGAFDEKRGASGQAEREGSSAAEPASPAPGNNSTTPHDDGSGSGPPRSRIRAQVRLASSLSRESGPRRGCFFFRPSHRLHARGSRAK